MPLGFAAFQVFTVDYVDAEQHGAEMWNTRVPRHLDEALIRIWPQLGRAISWPPQASPTGLEADGDLGRAAQASG